MSKVAAVTVAVCALAACSPAPVLRGEDGYVRLPAVAGRPAAAYFTLRGGTTDATLINISSTVAIRTEMHDTRATNGVSRMVQLATVTVPAEGAVRFAPGGRHVMLFSINPGIKRGSRVPLVFSFADGLRVTYNARAIAAGDPVPE